MPIENVSDTARWVAAYRAMETRRRDAIFNDPFAERLAGERGARMAAGMPRKRDAASSMAIRTAVIDEIVRELAGGVDLVVNLAAGLDARPWRLELPARLRWVDLDLPEILRYKTEIVNDQPRRSRTRRPPPICATPRCAGRCSHNYPHRRNVGDGNCGARARLGVRTSGCEERPGTRVPGRSSLQRRKVRCRDSSRTAHSVR